MAGARGICNPTTTEQWQEAVDSAHVLLLIDSAWKYKLIIGGPTVKVERCLEILGRGRELGIRPSPDAVDRLMRQVPDAADTTVRCAVCHQTQRVNYALCLKHGWPRCHGATMSMVTSTADAGQAVDEAVAGATALRKVMANHMKGARHGRPRGEDPTP